MARPRSKPQADGAGTVLARAADDQLVLSFEFGGERVLVPCGPCSLNLTDEKMPYEVWEAIGRQLGDVNRRSLWLVGDWILFGEAVYGEAAAQGVEATTLERYSEAERVTGLDHGTLMNVASICRRITPDRRRVELPFWVHEPVAKLEPDDQVRWLQKAIDEGWGRAQLRDSIRVAGAAPDSNPGSEPDSGGRGRLTIAEQIEAASRLVYTQAQRTEGGDGYYVPAEPMAQLASALGEE